MSVDLLVAALLAPASPADEPRAFVARLYSGYSDPEHNPLARPERVFAAPLVAAIREDRRLSRDEVGYMDADPLCQCQDPDGMRLAIESVRQTGRTRARAHVRLVFPGNDRRALTLHLVRTRSGWRIADIATADEASMLGGLRRFNRGRR